MRLMVKIYYVNLKCIFTSETDCDPFSALNIYHWIRGTGVV